MATGEKSVSVERLIDAPAEKIFAVLADPSQHPVIDGSGTVKKPRGSAERLVLGSKFGMGMRFGVPYMVRNTVIEFEQDRRIAWWHVAHDIWRYELEPVAGGTRVIETFDWSRGRAGPLLGKAPERNKDSMEKTLERLDKFVTTGSPEQVIRADERTLRAVANNAAWCDTVCRAHGCKPSFDGDVWVNPDPSPPLYPNVITLAPGAEREAAGRIPTLRDQLADSWAVKDSFSALDLSDAGFKLLFDAEWLYRPVSGLEASTGAWAPVRDARDLPPSLLDDPDVRFLATPDGGVIANRGGGVIGLSNATGAGLDRAGIAAAASLWPGLPLVGYANGDELKAMLDLGFEPVGPLRVWIT